MPSALMGDLRGADAYLHEVTQDQKGTTFRQSGPIDDKLLCSLHEELTQKADRYGIEFCKLVMAEVPQNGLRAEVRNPHPDRLVQFACLNVWRHCISKYGPGIGALGPYGKQLQAAVFDGGNDVPLLFVARNHLRIDCETESAIAIAPFPVRLGDIRCWLFCLSGVHFYLKLDKRPLPGESDGLIANGADPVTLLQLGPTLTAEVPFLQGLMANMVARRR